MTSFYANLTEFLITTSFKIAFSKVVYICLIFCASCNFCFKTEIQDKNKGTKNFPPEGEWIIFNFFPGFECGISLCTPYFKLFRAHLYICCIYWLGQELSQEIFTL